MDKYVELYLERANLSRLERNLFISVYHFYDNDIKKTVETFTTLSLANIIIEMFKLEEIMELNTNARS